MPNWSHGLAGIAGSLAAAGVGLGRPDLVDAARLGAEHLVTLADTSDGGMRLPHVIPDQDGLDTYTYTWCHGPAGTSLLFAALDRAGVTGVAGRSAQDWERACLHSLRESGIPERRHPGFWDNDGRCCGTAGVGDVVLNVWQRHGHDDDLAFVITLADALVDRAIHDRDGRAYWRFVEHRNEEPLLPPGVGWMQGQPASRRTSSGSRACWSRAATPTRSRGWTPGGRCPPGSAPDVGSRGTQRVSTRAGIGPPAVIVNGKCQGEGRVERGDPAASYEAREAERGFQHGEVVTDARAGACPEGQELPAVPAPRPLGAESVRVEGLRRVPQRRVAVERVDPDDQVGSPFDPESVHHRVAGREPGERGRWWAQPERFVDDLRGELERWHVVDGQ